MNIGDLKAALSEYSDHDPVVIVVERDGRDHVHSVFDVGDRNIDGELVVDLTVPE